MPETIKKTHDQEQIDNHYQGMPAKSLSESDETGSNNDIYDSISSFNWFIYDFETFKNSKFSLLTSDNPVMFLRTISQYGCSNFIEFIKHRNNAIALPISPFKCFMATSAIKPKVWDLKKTTKEMLSYINHTIIVQSDKCVLSIDNKQEDYVKKHLPLRKKNVDNLSTLYYSS